MSLSCPPSPPAAHRPARPKAIPVTDDQLFNTRIALRLQIERLFKLRHFRRDGVDHRAACLACVQALRSFSINHTTWRIAEA